MENLERGTRIYFRAKNPNPLFIEWLEYWLKEAEKKDSMKKHALAKALESIQKYPLVLYSGRDCAILDGFGSSICAMLDKQLEIYKASNRGKLLNEKQMEVKEKSIICDIKSALERKQNKIDPIEEFNKLDDTLEALLDGINGDLDENVKTVDDIQLPSTSSTHNIFVLQQQRLVAGKFKIILLVDTQETAGYSRQCLLNTIFI